MQVIFKICKNAALKSIFLQRWQPVFLAVGNRIIGALVLNKPSCLNEQSRAQGVILIFKIRECGQYHTNAVKCIKTCFLA